MACLQWKEGNQIPLELVGTFSREDEDAMTTEDHSKEGHLLEWLTAVSESSFY